MQATHTPFRVLLMQNLACALFPGLVLLVLIPSSIYLANQSEFGYSPRTLAPFLEAFGIWVAVAVAAAVFGTRRGRPGGWTFLLWAGLALLLRDMLCPIASSGLIGLDTTIAIRQPLGHTAIEIAILIALALAARRVPSASARSFLLPVAAYVFVLQVSMFGVKIALSAHRPAAPRAVASAPPPANGSGNVYLICLDSLSSDGYADILSAAGGSDDFDGFTCFPNNRANYTFTWPSLATVLSGSLYSDGSMREWVEAGRRHAGLLALLADRGYTVWQYGRERHDRVAPQRYTDIPPVVSGLNRTQLLRAIWLTRIVPTPGRAVTFAWSRAHRGFRRATSDLIVGSRRMLETFVADESRRPATGQAVYVHAYLPHFPFIFDADCREVADAGTFRGQATCALRSIVSLVHGLKEQSKFAAATIVIFGDHGCTAADPTPAAQADAARIRTLRHAAVGPFDHVDQMSRALLFVKPPTDAAGTAAPLAFSARVTQNADIPATVSDLLGLRRKWAVGCSVFAAAFPTNRAIDVYDGFGENIFPLIRDRDASLGLRTVSGPLQHYRYRKGAWRPRPDVLCTW